MSLKGVAVHVEPADAVVARPLSIGLRVETPASLSRILLIDLGLLFYQLFTLYVAYLADPLPVGTPDLLLCPNNDRPPTKHSVIFDSADGLEQSQDGTRSSVPRSSNVQRSDLGSEGRLDDEDGESERDALLQGEHTHQFIDPYSIFSSSDKDFKCFDLSLI